MKRLFRVVGAILIGIFVVGAGHTHKAQARPGGAIALNFAVGPGAAAAVQSARYRYRRYYAYRPYRYWQYRRFYNYRPYRYRYRYRYLRSPRWYIPYRRRYRRRW